MTWATDDLFVAGGDFVSEHWREFQAQAGVTAVIVVSAAKFAPLIDPAPAAMLWLPVAEESAYTLEHFALGTQFVDWALAAKRKVLLHAPAGMHRTRPLVAAHLLRRGKSLARVLKEMEQPPWMPPYKGEAALLEQWLSSTD